MYVMWALLKYIMLCSYIAWGVHTAETFFVDKSLSPNQMHPVPIIPIMIYYILL